MIAPLLKHTTPNFLCQNWVSFGVGCHSCAFNHHSRLSKEETVEVNAHIVEEQCRVVRREGWWTDDPIEEKLLFLASVESAKIPTKDVFRFFSLRCVLLKWTCFQVDAMEKISIRVLISLPLTCPFPLNASSTQLLYRRVALLDVFLKVHNTFSFVKKKTLACLLFLQDQVMTCNKVLSWAKLHTWASTWLRGGIDFEKNFRGGQIFGNFFQGG